MTDFSYSGAATSDRDAVRLLIGDTDPGEPLLRDADIDYLLTLGGSVITTAILAAGVCANLAARLVRRAQGPFQADLQDRQAHFRQVAADLRAMRSAVTPVAPLLARQDPLDAPVVTVHEFEERVSDEAPGADTLA